MAELNSATTGWSKSEIRNKFEIRITNDRSSKFEPGWLGLRREERASNPQIAGFLGARLRYLKLRFSSISSVLAAFSAGLIITRSVSEGFFGAVLSAFLADASGYDSEKSATSKLARRSTESYKTKLGE